MPKLMLILADQLYSEIPFENNGEVDFVMLESFELCNRLPYHKYKLTFILTCLRQYKNHLKNNYSNSKIHYFDLDQKQEFPEVLKKLSSDYDTVCHFEIDDKPFASKIDSILQGLDLKIETLPSPKFLLSNSDQKDYYQNHKPKRTLMNDFYIYQRKRLNILVTKDNLPVAGQWSFDEQNRKKLPKTIQPSNPNQSYSSPEYIEVCNSINKFFPDNVGNLPETSWLPTNHVQAKQWLGEFLQTRLALFGDYEDALTNRSEIVFHSALSPLLNNGLITPDQILKELEYYLQSKHSFSIFEPNTNEQLPELINSIEGFIRQIIGWREWIKMMYDNEYNEDLNGYNFFAAKNPLPSYFWKLETNDAELNDNYPLGQVLDKINDYSWSHHIERLMVLSNWMLLNEYDPVECLDWFKCMFVDAYDWVMVPNVIGMGLFADGGIFATKPYVAGGNYLKKMSDYPDSKIWEKIWTDKFWQFLLKHQEYFKTNPRMNMLIQGRLNKM